MNIPKFLGENVSLIFKDESVYGVGTSDFIEMPYTRYLNYRATELILKAAIEAGIINESNQNQIHPIFARLAKEDGIDQDIADLA